MVIDLTENSRSFFHGSKTFWATVSRVTGKRAMQRVYLRSEQQRASPWRLTMPPVRGWGPAIEHYQRATSSRSALEGHRCAERYVCEHQNFLRRRVSHSRHTKQCVMSIVLYLST